MVRRLKRNRSNLPEDTVIAVGKKQKSEITPTTKVIDPDHKAPSNPQATFQGIPAELRLAIYNYACDLSLLHVHRHERAKTREHYFTWTVCRSPNPRSALLCANPKWSGMCKEEDRCTYKVQRPPEPRGFWALAASSKSVRNETREFFLRNVIVSIHAHHLVQWMDHISQAQRDSIRQITLTGYHDQYSLIHETDTEYLRLHIPNLKAIGVQCQDDESHWVHFVYSRRYLQIENNAWKWWRPLELLRRLDPTISIAAEAIVCQRPNNEAPRHQQAVVRIFRGEQPRTEGATDFDFGDADRHEEGFEISISAAKKLAACRKNTGWKQWW